jgi:hypothetical protein
MDVFSDLDGQTFVWESEKALQNIFKTEYGSSMPETL